MQNLSGHVAALQGAIQARPGYQAARVVESTDSPGSLDVIQDGKQPLNVPVAARVTAEDFVTGNVVDQIIAGLEGQFPAAGGAAAAGPSPLSARTASGQAVGISA